MCPFYNFYSLSALAVGKGGKKTWRQVKAQQGWKTHRGHSSRVTRAEAPHLATLLLFLQRGRGKECERGREAGNGAERISNLQAGEVGEIEPSYLPVAKIWPETG